MDDDQDKKSGGIDGQIAGNKLSSDEIDRLIKEARDVVDRARLDASELTPTLGLDYGAGNISATDLTHVVSPTQHVLALDTVIKELDKRTNEVAEKLDGYPAKFDELTAAIERIKEIHSAFHRIIGEPAKELEGFRAQVVEDLKLKEARQLWMDRADRARREYRASWYVLAILLLVIPGLAIWQSGAIFAFFRSIGEAVLVDLPENASETAILIAAVSRLVLVTMPVALYIWLIRILVRYNMRSLLLIDDAEQRNTMLETYLHLVERDADVKADRPLILEALFRRTPGHGPETIEPPNLADVLKLGSKPGGPA